MALSGGTCSRGMTALMRCHRSCGISDVWLGYKVQGSGFRVQGSGYRVQGTGFRVQGSGFRVQGSGCRVNPAPCTRRHAARADPPNPFTLHHKSKSLRNTRKHTLKDLTDLYLEGKASQGPDYLTCATFARHRCRANRAARLPPRLPSQPSNRKRGTCKTVTARL